jgi:large subunit ribosomal protein L30
MLAVVRIRGSVKTDQRIVDTLGMLRLNRVNHCVLVPDTKDVKGMLKKATSWITWGNIDDGTIEKLLLKRGRTMDNKKLDDKAAKDVAKKISKNQSMKDAGIKPVFRLSPPSKGHKSTKLHYPKGALGNRKEKINDLIKRMM